MLIFLNFYHHICGSRFRTECLQSCFQFSFLARLCFGLLVAILKLSWCWARKKEAEKYPAVKARIRWLPEADLLSFLWLIGTLFSIITQPKLLHSACENARAFLIDRQMPTQCTVFGNDARCMQSNAGLLIFWKT